MGNSLRDELLKVGLASEERLRKPQEQKRSRAKPASKRRKSPTRAPTEESNATARHVLRENQRRTARFIRDATLGGGSAADNAKRVLWRKIQALIESERLNDAQADVPYHFVKGKRIKRIYVTEQQRLQLSSGGIVIAALEGHHHILSTAAAEKLLALAPQTVVCVGAEASEGGDVPPVPDDITW